MESLGLSIIAVASSISVIVSVVGNLLRRKRQGRLQKNPSPLRDKTSVDQKKTYRKRLIWVKNKLCFVDVTFNLPKPSGLMIQYNGSR